MRRGASSGTPRTVWDRCDRSLTTTATVRSAAGKLADGMAAAADTLRGLLTHADDSLRLRAASKLLELGLKTWQVVDLEAQVSELSERLAVTEAMLDEPK